MRARSTPLLISVAASAALAAVAVVHAQDADEAAGQSTAEDHAIDQALALAAMAGEDGTPDELEAWRLAAAGRHIKAREIAERVVEADPRSYVGHFVLGFVQHYGEANFPRALYHLDESYRLFEARHGDPPQPDAPWRWHSRILRELAFTHGDLEHHADKVRYIAEYNVHYDPDMLAEQAWPLMKMGRHEEARAAARMGLAEGSPRQLEVALNALCAIEFEAGNDGASYEACKQALDFGRSQPGGPNAVDLTNFAEAARSMFKLDEAERISLEATEADVAWYGNPWLELSELYTREGRFAEALQALREVPRYRAKRPPHVRDADRNEGRRALGAFFVVVGRPADAIRITSKALVAPDRRAHNSRDPNQDRAISALLDRRARLMEAEMIDEEAASRPFWKNAVRWAEAAWLRTQAWTSGRQAAKLLADDERFIGTFRIGTSKSAITPPWLAGELAQVAGPGVVAEAVRRARAVDERAGSDAYYDAFAAEAALEAGDEARAVELATRALEGLGPAEALLRARVLAVEAEAHRRRGDLSRALPRYESAFQIDPGIFRRLGLVVPVRIEGARGPIAEEVADGVGWSPRFDEGDGGLTVRIDVGPSGGEVCLLGTSGAVLGCGETEAQQQEDPDELAARIVDEFHRGAFAPRVDMSVADVNSLDGTNTVGRDALDDVLQQHGPAPWGEWSDWE